MVTDKGICLRRHFQEILCVISFYNQAALNGMEQFSAAKLNEWTIVKPPDRNEILGALGQFSVGKAGGFNDLLPDVLKCCGGPF